MKILTLVLSCTLLLMVIIATTGFDKPAPGNRIF
jgi:hypothetical protein